MEDILYEQASEVVEDGGPSSQEISTIDENVVNASVNRSDINSSQVVWFETSIHLQERRVLRYVDTVLIHNFTSIDQLDSESVWIVYLLDLSV